MCFKKLTFKNVLAITMLFLTISVFSFTFFAPVGLAEAGQVFPPPPAVTDTTTVTSTGSSTNPDSSEEQITTLDIIMVVITNLI